MNEKKLRLAKNEQEILRSMQEIAEQKLDVTLWQNKDDGRLVLTVYFKEVDIHNKEITVSFKDKSQEFELDEKLVCFFREDSKNILFKEKVKVVSKKLVESPVPTEIQCEDRRSSDREVLGTRHGGCDHNVTFNLYSQVDQGQKLMDCEVYDVSSTGIALKLKANMKKYFDEGAQLTLKEFNGKKLDEEIKGSVVYVLTEEDAKKLHHSVFHRVGVRFSKEYPLASIMK